MIEEFVDFYDWRDCIEITRAPTEFATPTGRANRVTGQISGGTFYLTYADGLADINLARLSAHHVEHGAIATMTVVRPEPPYGLTEIAANERIRRVSRETAVRALDQRLLLLRAARLGLPDRGQRARARAARGPGGGGPVARPRRKGVWDCREIYKDALLLNNPWAKGAACGGWEPAVQ